MDRTITTLHETNLQHRYKTGFISEKVDLTRLQKIPTVRVGQFFLNTPTKNTKKDSQSASTSWKGALAK